MRHELVDNAVDEALAGHCATVNVTVAAQLLCELDNPTAVACSW